MHWGSSSWDKVKVDQKIKWIFNPTWTMNIELLKMTLDLLSAWANVHFSSKGRSFDRQADFTSVHKTLWSQKKKEKFKYASIGLQVSYHFVSIFSFCCLASLQEIRVQVGGHHESFCSSEISFLPQINCLFTKKSKTEILQN